MDSQPHIIFDSQKYLSRRERAIKNTARHRKNPWFLHDFAAQGAIDTIAATIQDFENGLEIFSCLGQFEKFGLAQHLIGENGKIKNLKQIEPSSSDFGGINCISQLKSLELDNQKYDLIIANSGLNFVNDLPGLLVKIKNALNENGVFIGSFIGNNSLRELRETFMHCEIEEFGGAGMRVSPMIELESAVRLLTRVGFKSPVSSVESLKVRYDNVFSLFRDIKNMGENAAFAQKHEKQLNRRLIAKIADYYQDKFKDDDGRVFATFDIVTICGWA